jgi:molecular chaperone DnaK (HSP70)
MRPNSEAYRGSSGPAGAPSAQAVISNAGGGAMAGWAIDLGTTNTEVAVWNEGSGQPRLLELNEICRKPGGEDPLQAPRLVPSATDLLEDPGLWDRVGTWPFIARRVFLGHQAIIGRPAIERNEGLVRPSFVPTFKRYLDREAIRPLARVGSRVFTAREVAYHFLRELLVAVKRQTGERLREIVFTTPVETYDSYRAELTAIGKRLGIQRLRFLDEPVASALGYGLGLAQDRIVIVVDMGGGTIHFALVRLSPAGAQQGHAHVLAKEGRPMGGNVVDGWLLTDVCKTLGYEIPEDPDNEEARFWRRLMFAEACRVKEAVYFQETATFRLTPPVQFTAIDSRAPGGAPLLPVSRDGLVDVLRRNGLYAAIEECLDGLWEHEETRRLSPADVEEVLMVGGSTLLPNVYPLLEERFGRNKIRAWQPFEAVAFGASVFAAGRFGQSDFIVHDYAFVTYDRKTNEPQYNVIVPRGTRFPTPDGFWRRQVTPTCSLGEPETIFKLVICEIGVDAGSGRRFVWDASGGLHVLGGENVGKNEKVIVPLNETNPTLGYLEPPHPPSDRRPRLEIAFGVNEDRWLHATVKDLLTRRVLMEETPVVRLI